MHGDAESWSEDREGQPCIEKNENADHDKLRTTTARSSSARAAGKGHFEGRRRGDSRVWRNLDLVEQLACGGLHRATAHGAMERAVGQPRVDDHLE